MPKAAITRTTVDAVPAGSTLPYLSTIAELTPGDYLYRWASEDIRQDTGSDVTSWQASNTADPKALFTPGSSPLTSPTPTPPSLVADLGRRVLSFDGVGDILNAPIGFLWQPYTLVTVTRFDSPSAGLNIVAGGTAASSTNVMFASGTTGNLGQNNGVQSTSTTQSTAGWNTRSYVANGAASFAQTGSTATTPADAGTRQLTGLALARWATLKTALRVAEVVLYPRALTTAELTAVHASLKTYYGI